MNKKLLDKIESIIILSDTEVVSLYILIFCKNKIPYTIFFAS